MDRGNAGLRWRADHHAAGRRLVLDHRLVPARGFGHLLLIRAMEHTSPSTLAPFVYSQLIWSTLLAYLTFGDFPEPITLFGMFVVLAAGLLAVNWQHMRRLSDAADQARTH